MRDIDQIIEALTSASPTLHVRQLRVSHPGDDNGIWFFRNPDCELEVQIESSTGMCPFLIETDENDIRITAASVPETVASLTQLLHLNTEKSR